MPTSIIATFTLLLAAGFTLNFMSLMGLAISVGILVANSIVVLENIIRRIQLGEAPPVAADLGTAEIALAVVASTLTNIVVFAPIAFMVGIVVNNGILLLDYIRVLRERGQELVESILEACSSRLRPIIMMNLAVALGMLPLALGLGEGSETRAPMAIVSIGGIMTSTGFTLFLIPVIYLTLSLQSDAT